MEQEGCGVGVTTRSIECKRSDGATVEAKYCFLQGEDVDLLSSVLFAEATISLLGLLYFFLPLDLPRGWFESTET